LGTTELAIASNVEVPLNHRKKTAGKNWLTGLMRRHPEISLQQP